MSNSVPTERTQAGASLWRDVERCYRAVRARDARFDGQFITAVRTTRIYCRPSCPSRTPKPGNVRFFPTTAAAQSHGYRACRRCLPDAVPGSPEWNVRADLAGRTMRLIADGTVEREGVSGLAQRLGYSERHLGRVLTAELGAGPLALARAHRAHAARLLIELSDLAITDVAFAAGFSSVRQFNDTIRDVFATTPSLLRTRSLHRRSRTSPASGTSPAPERSEPSTWTKLTLRLPFRPPLDVVGLFGFLAARAVPGVESDDGGYHRTLHLAHGHATVHVTPLDHHLACTLRLIDVRDLAGAVARVRRLFDLDADPHAVQECLGDDPVLAPLVRAIPGMRVPGAVDGPELVLRTVLGQQVSVVAARAAAARLTTELGDRLEPAAQDTDRRLTRLFPSPGAVAEHAHEVLAGPRRRIDTVRTVAEALATDALDVHVGRDAEELRRDLIAAPGIGPWTADYVTMRLLGHPDILLNSDRALRRGASALGLTADPAKLLAHGRTWRPWRSYAGMYLWHADTETTKTTPPKGSS